MATEEGGDGVGVGSIGDLGARSSASVAATNQEMLRLLSEGGIDFGQARIPGGSVEYRSLPMSEGGAGGGDDGGTESGKGEGVPGVFKAPPRAELVVPRASPAETASGPYTYGGGERFGMTVAPGDVAEPGGGYASTGTSAIGAASGYSGPGSETFREYYGSGVETRASSEDDGGIHAQQTQGGYGGKGASKSEGVIIVNGHSYKYVSGGAGKGAAPFGAYEVTGEKEPIRGMESDGVSYDFILADRPGSGRANLRLHPSACGITEGCFGIRGDRKVQESFRADMRQELRRYGGHVPLHFSADARED